MRKLALDDEILLSVQQPARYIGGEVNNISHHINQAPDVSKTPVLFVVAVEHAYPDGIMIDVEYYQKELRKILTSSVEI